MPPDPACRLPLLHPRYWPGWLALLLLRAGACLPTTARWPVASVLGDLLRLAAPSRRRIARRNLALCYPELDALARAGLLQQNFRSLAKGFLEAAGIGGLPAARLLAESGLRGLEHLDAARAAGHGVLLAGLHMDSLERAIAALGLRTEVDFVYRQQSSALWDEVLRRGRGRFVARLIERHDVRALLRSLRQGRAVWYLPDQDYGAKHSVFAPFFGNPAASLAATARIARLSGAPVLFVTHWREADDRQIVEISPPLQNFPTPDPVADATRINALVEAAVRAHPEQYLWVHRRFKTRPADMPGNYRG